MNDKNLSQSKKTVEISFNWAITIICGALLTGLVSGAFGVGTILNSDHFALATNIEKVEQLEGNMKAIMVLLGDIKADVAEIKGQLKVK